MLNGDYVIEIDRGRNLDRNSATPQFTLQAVSVFLNFGQMIYVQIIYVDGILLII